MKKIKLVVSDFHLGWGARLANGSLNPQEDFRRGRQFVEFLSYFSSGDYATTEVELVINGDFFNILAIQPGDEAPALITETVALRKLEAILAGHPKVFEALAQFSRSFLHHVVFVVGNHDPGLLFSSFQGRLRALLGERISFHKRVYAVDGIHIEHGNQYFADNRYDEENYFLSDELDEPVVNLPWGSQFLIHFLYPIKAKRPYIDQVFPFSLYLRWALVNDTGFALKVFFKLVWFFLTYRFWQHPNRRSPFRETLRILKEITFSPRLDREAERILKENSACRAVVFGHTHQARHIQLAAGKEYLNTGTWNELISLDVGSTGRTSRLTFGLVEYLESGVPRLSLKEWKGTYRVMEDTF